MFTGAKRGGLIKGNALLLDNEGLYVVISLKENDSPKTIYLQILDYLKERCYSTISWILLYISYSITNK